MDYKLLLETEITNGFSKRDLEYLIGLPKNNLSSFLSGNRSLSKKSFLKIERWITSKDKPDPLSFKISINDKGTKEDEWLKVATVENDIIKKNIEVVVSVPLLNQKKKEFRPFVKGENSVSYSEEKREWKLNNQ